MSRVALCIDEMTARNPSLIGLHDENIAAQKWLAVYSTAENARASIYAERDFVEVWVAGCDDAEAINLAAAIKHDRPHLRVCLVTREGNGSLLSRAGAASIDAVYDEGLFVRRYSAVKVALASAFRRSFVPDPNYDIAKDCLEDNAETGLFPKGICLDGITARESSCHRNFSDEPLTAIREEAKSVSGISSQPRGAALKTAFLLSVLSGSGGAGKSTVSALAALCAQMRGKKTLLIDFDYQFGNVASFFREVKPVGVDELLKDLSSIGGLECSGALPAIVSPPRNPEESEVIVGHTADLIDSVSQHFDVVVANTGALWAEQHAALLERSSKALFLVDQRASSLQSCHRALLLCERCGIATGPMLFVVNRCRKNAPLSSIDVSCALKGAEAVELRDGGREVEDYSSAGVLADLAVAANPLYSSVDGLVAGLIPGADADPPVPIGGEASRSRSRRRGLFWRGDNR